MLMRVIFYCVYYFVYCLSFQGLKVDFIESAVVAFSQASVHSL